MLDTCLYTIPVLLPFALLFSVAHSSSRSLVALMAARYSCRRICMSGPRRAASRETAGSDGCRTTAARPLIVVVKSSGAAAEAPNDVSLYMVGGNRWKTPPEVLYTCVVSRREVLKWSLWVVKGLWSRGMVALGDHPLSRRSAFGIDAVGCTGCNACRCIGTAYCVGTACGIACGTMTDL